MGFPRQEYWSGLPCPPPGTFPDPGIELLFPALAGRLFTTEPSTLHSFFMVQAFTFSDLMTTAIGYLCMCAQSCTTLWNPWTVAHHAPLSMEFSRQEYWSGLPVPSQGDLPNPGIEPRSPTLQADSSPAKPQGPKNPGMGSLSLLQEIFLTQESNRGLLHCRWILYQLSYQGINTISGNK